MTEQPKVKISLGEAAYRRLRADIMSCRIAPGERLTERQLIESTGFGASPIRAALTRLDQADAARHELRALQAIIKDPAIADLTILLNLDSQKVDAYIMRGIANFSLCRYEKAKKNFTRAIKIDKYLN